MRLNCGLSYIKRDKVNKGYSSYLIKHLLFIYFISIINYYTITFDKILLSLALK